MPPTTGSRSGRRADAESVQDPVESGEVTGQVAKDAFAEMVEQGADPQDIIAERGLAQVNDEGAIADLVDTVLATSPGKVEQYRAGKTALFGFFVGQVIKGSQGKANPRVVQQLVRERLG